MRVNLLQIMKLVVGCALASAYFLPFVRLAEAGIATWSAMLLMGAIAVPLVFALVTIVLARKGPLKNWLVQVLCMTSVGVALGSMVEEIAKASTTWVRRGMHFDLHSLASLAVLGLPAVMFSIIFAVLLRRVVSARRIAFRARARADCDPQPGLGGSSRVEKSTAGCRYSSNFRSGDSRWTVALGHLLFGSERSRYSW